MGDQVSVGKVIYPITLLGAPIRDMSVVGELAKRMLNDFVECFDQLWSN